MASGLVPKTNMILFNTMKNHPWSRILKKKCLDESQQQAQANEYHAPDERVRIQRWSHHIESVSSLP